MPYRHEALFYRGPEELLAGLVPFVEQGRAAGEPVLIAARPQTLAHLRGIDAELVEIPRNPARIIPFWRDFVDAHDGPVRGVGEPIWAGRGADELVECQLHEQLLNVAFDEDFALLCPYDTAALDTAVLHEARCSHPLVDAAPSTSFRAGELPLAPLSPPPAGHRVLGFDLDALPEVRRLVEAHGADPEFVLAVDELAANSVRHGGGHGIVLVWREDDALVCEVRDQGRIRDALAGRVRPDAGRVNGRGLWLVNAICDLVQIRPGAVRVRSAPALPPL